MDIATWRPFLECWSRETIDLDPEYAATLPADVVDSAWLGYPGASDEQLRALEERLGTGLPATYRTFLATTNGFRQTTPFIERMWSTDEVEWFAVRNQQWIDAWTTDITDNSGTVAFAPLEIPDEEYFVYGPDQDCVKVRTGYMQAALEISDRWDSGIYLLNPQVVAPDGEWEAWFLDTKLAGAQRYRSFWEMMQAEHDCFLRLAESRRRHSEP